MLLSCSNACMQVWDLNKPAPEDVGRDYHLVLASNVLHTAANMASAPPYAPAYVRPLHRKAVQPDTCCHCSLISSSHTV